MITRPLGERMACGEIIRANVNGDDWQAYRAAGKELARKTTSHRKHCAKCRAQFKRRR